MVGFSVPFWLKIPCTKRSICPVEGLVFIGSGGDGWGCVKYFFNIF